MRLVPHGLKKHKSMCCAPLVSRQFSLDDVLSHDNNTLAHCDAASHLVRVEKLRDIPICPTIDEDSDRVMHAVRRCCRLLHVDSYIADGAAREAVRILHGDRRFMKEQRIWGTTQKLYEAYTADMTVDTSEVLVPDDKEKKFMWELPLLCYQWLLFKFAMLSPAWELSVLGLNDAEAWCQEVFVSFYLQGSKCFLKFISYGTIKSECFATGRACGHVCTKPAHSCLRKIVSFCKWPFRR